mgnify:CR=1 FL=1
MQSSRMAITVTFTNSDNVIEFPDFHVPVDDVPAVEEYTVNSHLKNLDTTKATISEDYPT